MIRKLMPNIVCLQETRKEIKNTPSFDYINLIRQSGNLSQGGGIAVGIDAELFYRNLSELIPEVLKDNLEILFI